MYMTVRELINKLMDLDLDKPVYITEFGSYGDSTVGYIGLDPINNTGYDIKDISVHDIFGTRFNCITIGK